MGEGLLPPLREVIARHGLAARHSLGQHFLLDGNLTDRIVHHHVIDFIDLHFGTYVYPTFNVADCGICVGVVLYIWQSLRAPKAPPATSHQ